VRVAAIRLTLIAASKQTQVSQHMNWLKRLFTQITVTNTPSLRPAPPTNPSESTTADELRARYGTLTQQALHLRPVNGGGFSRLGGLPLMPAAMDWPEWKGKPLAFLAQLDLNEMHCVLPSFLPSDGYLYFFYDQEQGVWGFDPKDIGGWRVLYAEGDAHTFAARQAPAGLDEQCVFREKSVAPHVVHLLPDSQRLPRGTFDWKRDGEPYQALRDAVFEGAVRHQMLGFPSPVQGDDMELECQLASNGIYVGNAEGYKDSRVPALKEKASEWKLLLQLDTDDDTGWMWGDVGTLYFWVRESDAQRRDFSKVWMVFQCC